MSVSISGAWDFNKYPIYPFEPTARSLKDHALLDVILKLTTGTIYRVEITSASTLVCNDAIKIAVEPHLTADLVKQRVMEQAGAKFKDEQSRNNLKIINLIADECYAALRRIATEQDGGQTLSEIDHSYLAGIKINPQQLGFGGVPNAVFHRLHAAKKVIINSAGLVAIADNGE